jgi:hypothetical protein
MTILLIAEKGSQLQHVLGELVDTNIRHQCLQYSCIRTQDNDNFFKHAAICEELNNKLKIIIILEKARSALWAAAKFGVTQNVTNLICKPSKLCSLRKKRRSEQTIPLSTSINTLSHNYLPCSFVTGHAAVGCLAESYRRTHRRCHCPRLSPVVS